MEMTSSPILVHGRGQILQLPPLFLLYSGEQRFAAGGQMGPGISA